MNRHRVVLVVALLLTAAASIFATWRGFASDASSTSTPVASAPSSESGGSGTEVEIVDFDFRPRSITVPVGATVQWTNRDDSAHSIRSSKAAFTEQTMKQNEMATATFSAPGTYDYICGIHPYMTGAVVVQ